MRISYTHHMHQLNSILRRVVNPLRVVVHVVTFIRPVPLLILAVYPSTADCRQRTQRNPREEKPRIRTHLIVRAQNNSNVTGQNQQRTYFNIQSGNTPIELLWFLYGQFAIDRIVGTVWWLALIQRERFMILLPSVLLSSDCGDERRLRGLWKLINNDLFCNCLHTTVGNRLGAFVIIFFD